MTTPLRYFTLQYNSNLEKLKVGFPVTTTLKTNKSKT